MASTTPRTSTRAYGLRGTLPNEHRYIFKELQLQIRGLIHSDLQWATFPDAAAMFVYANEPDSPGPCLEILQHGMPEERHAYSPWDATPTAREGTCVHRCIFPFGLRMAS